MHNKQSIILSTAEMTLPTLKDARRNEGDANTLTDDTPCLFLTVGGRDNGVGPGSVWESSSIPSISPRQTEAGLYLTSPQQGDLSSREEAVKCRTVTNRLSEGRTHLQALGVITMVHQRWGCCPSLWRGCCSVEHLLTRISVFRISPKRRISQHTGLE